jgi:hypothetical protein
MHYLRLWCPTLWVDVRVAGINGRWLASADSPDGVTLGLGRTPRQALIRALKPFEGLIDDLLDTAPDDLRERRALG